MTGVQDRSTRTNWPEHRPTGGRRAAGILATWDSAGIPDNPRAWVIVTARRCAVDRIRPEARRADKEASDMALIDDGDDPPESVLRDDLLRLVFTCWHPGLSPDARVALSLTQLGQQPASRIASSIRSPRTAWSPLEAA